MSRRSISADREKYQAYLCSREWAERREGVRERAGGICERCRVLPMDAVHHLTYARKYAEPLEDLQAICNSCHEFTHGKSAFDPAEWGGALHWLQGCGDARPPMPIEVLCRTKPESILADPYSELIQGIRLLHAAKFHAAAQALAETLPFSVPGGYFKPEIFILRADAVRKCYQVCGWASYERHEWWKPENDTGVDA